MATTRRKPPELGGFSVNPFSWLRDAQDWFARTEKSSGFRPYLIFLLVIFGFALILLSRFKEIPGLVTLVEWLIGGSVAAFILVFIVKAFQDPDFARSETHVQRMAKIGLEQMGTESEMIDGEIIEKKSLDQTIPDSKQLDVTTTKELE